MIKNPRVKPTQVVFMELANALMVAAIHEKQHGAATSGIIATIGALQDNIEVTRDPDGDDYEQMAIIMEQLAEVYRIGTE